MPERLFHGQTMEEWNAGNDPKVLTILERMMESAEGKITAIYAQPHLNTIVVEGPKRDTNVFADVIDKFAEEFNFSPDGICGTM